MSLGCHWVSGARLLHISHHPAGTSDPTHPANGNQTTTTTTSLSWAQHSGTQSGECLHPSTGGEAAGVQHVCCLCSLPPTQVPGPGAGMTPAPASTSSSHLPNTGTGYTAPTTRHHSQLAHAAPCSMTPGSPSHQSSGGAQSSEPGTFGTDFTIPHVDSVDSVDSELRWCGQWTMQCGQCGHLFTHGWM